MNSRRTLVVFVALVLVASFALVAASWAPLFGEASAPGARGDATRVAHRPSREASRLRERRAEPPARRPRGEVAARMREAARLEAGEEAERARRLGVDPKAPIEEQLETYRASVEDTSGVDLSDPSARLLRGPATEAFLRLEVVQERLRGLGREERAATLGKIREGLGWGEDALVRQAAVDAAKQRKWDEGLAYMTEREALLVEHDEGEALEAELSELRERYFGDAAVTLGREEAAGFFRFSRRRVIGRN